MGATGVAALAGAAAACSSKKATDSGPSGPVTIRHMFGETTIPAPPSRVVCAGYTGQDDLLALGVVPIAVTDWFGDQPFAVWPWARHRLGAAQPVVLSLDSGIPVAQIAALRPDLIVATNAGVDADTYQRLAAIAPTVPQSAGDAFFEPWKTQAEAIGQAVHREQRMRSLIADVDRRFSDVAAAHPGFKGKRALLLQPGLDRGELVAARGWRIEFLTQMGLTVPDTTTAIPTERIKDTLANTDVLIWTADDDAQRQLLLANPDIAAAAARSIFTTTEQGGAIAFASPLSYPMVAEQLPPLIAKITG